jgi:hypothetical protein
MADLGTAPDPLRDRIIDAALALAAADAGGGWYDLRLHLVAQRLGDTTASGSASRSCPGSAFAPVAHRRR